MSQNTEVKQRVKQLDRIAIGLSVVVLIVVVALRYLPGLAADNFPFDIHLLPALHAILNSLTALSLLGALYFIKQKRINEHQRMIYLAMGLSALFLVSYVVYHLVTEPTSYGGEGTVRFIYFFLLITHIVTAAIVLPFILFTFIRGFAMDIPAHKRIARWTFPIWLYVAVTGPICYLMLMPYYS